MGNMCFVTSSNHLVANLNQYYMIMCEPNLLLILQKSGEPLPSPPPPPIADR